MNPVIWAAIISGGWAAIVAALGYRYNRVTAKATSQAVNANALTALDAGHQAQLWEKKAEAYVDTIAQITRRQAARFHLTRMLRFDEATGEKMRESYAAPEDWNWADASARIAAYAPRPILEALAAANAANQEVSASYGQWKALAEQRESVGPDRTSSSQIMEAFGTVETAVVAAARQIRRWKKPFALTSRSSRAIAPNRRHSSL